MDSKQGKVRSISIYEMRFLFMELNLQFSIILMMTTVQRERTTLNLCSEHSSSLINCALYNETRVGIGTSVFFFKLFF